MCAAEKIHFFDTEHLSRTYLKMALPVASGMIITILYNLADTFFIAQTGDTNLVAGVSLCAPVFTTLMAFGNIYGQGGSSLISRMLGKGDEDGIRRASAFCFYIAIATGMILGALMLTLRSPLLHLLGASGKTLPHARSYYTVMAFGAPALVLNFIHMNLVRCEGMATESMLGGVVGSIVNIILDPILISALRMGTAGAALASVAGYLCSILYFLLLLKKRSRYLSVHPGYVHISRSELKQILGVGISAALANLMQSLSVILINHALLPYGNERIAAMGIALKVNMIAQLILTGLAFGGVPLYGYLFGAGLMDNLRALIRFCVSFLGSLALVLTVFLFVMSGPLIRFFMADPVIVSEGSRMLRYLSAGAVFSGLVLLITVLFQASGQIISALVMSVARQGILFVIVLTAASKLFGYAGVLAATPMAECLSLLLAALLYRSITL